MDVNTVEAHARVADFLKVPQDVLVVNVVRRGGPVEAEYVCGCGDCAGCLADPAPDTPWSRVRPRAAQDGLCQTCGEPLHLTDLGLIGNGGVCRDDLNPNQDDEGQHILGGAR